MPFRLAIRERLTTATLDGPPPRARERFGWNQPKIGPAAQIVGSGFTRRTSVDDDTRAELERLSRFCSARVRHRRESPGPRLG